MTKTMTENANFQVESNFDPATQIEAATEEEKQSLEYLSLDMLEAGKARNVVTVRIRTQTGDFLVDIIKRKALHNHLDNETLKEFRELHNRLLGNTDMSAADFERYDELQNSIAVTEIADLVVKPNISISETDAGDLKLQINGNEIPQDTAELLADAVTFLRKGDLAAANAFQKPNE